MKVRNHEDIFFRSDQDFKVFRKSAGIVSASDKMHKNAEEKMQECAGEEEDMLNSFCQRNDRKGKKWKEHIGWKSEATGSKG